MIEGFVQGCGVEFVAKQGGAVAVELVGSEVGEILGSGIGLVPGLLGFGQVAFDP